MASMLEVRPSKDNPNFRPSTLKRTPFTKEQMAAREAEHEARLAAVIGDPIDGPPPTLTATDLREVARQKGIIPR